MSGYRPLCTSHKAEFVNKLIQSPSSLLPKIDTIIDEKY